MLFLSTLAFKFQLRHLLILINGHHLLFAQGVFTCEMRITPYTCLGLAGKFDLVVRQMSISSTYLIFDTSQYDSHGIVCG